MRVYALARGAEWLLTDETWATGPVAEATAGTLWVFDTRTAAARVRRRWRVGARRGIEVIALREVGALFPLEWADAPGH